MTIFLKNVSKAKTITLRYGDGMNKMIQIKAGEQKPYPAAMNQGLLAHYLSSFKGDLQVIDSKKPVAVKGDKYDEEKKATTVQVPEEKDEKKDGEESPSNELPDGSDKEAGDENPVDQPEDSSEENDKPEEGQDDSKDEAGSDSNGERSEEQVKDDEQGQSEDEQQGDDAGREGSDEGSEEALALTEKQLNKLNAEQIKELAKSLGIEVTEDATKKGLIPVILEKQGK